MTFRQTINKYLIGHRTTTIVVLCLFGLCLLQAVASPRKKGPRKKSDERVYLIHADEMFYDQFGNNPMAQIVKGHVAFRHQGARLTCDSAYFFQESNSVKAFGHVFLKQGDTLSLACERALYDGQAQMMEARQNVVLHHRRQVLRTDSLNFDRLYNNAYFFEGGTLIDGKDRLISDWGEYNTDTRQAVFCYNVKLKSASRLISTDTLYYDVKTSVAHVVGPNSRITSGQSVIDTQDAYYDTHTDKAQLFSRSTVVDKNRTITGDSLYYVKDGESRGYGNVIYVDRDHKNALTCGYLRYNEKTGMGFATRDPVAKEFSQKDTLYVHSDSMKIYTFNINTDSVYRKVHAFHKVRAYRTDMQAVCDSMVFDSQDSCMTMYRDPIVWNGNRQLLGEQIKVYMNDSTVRRADVIGQALSVELMGDSVHYNQVSSKEMKAFFVDGDVRRTEAIGNVQAVYFPISDKDSAIIGLNYTETDTMRMFMSPKRELEKIWMPKATGTLYPLTQIPPSKLKLSNFAWFDDIRPKSKDDIFVWRGKGTGQELKNIPRHEAPLQQLGGGKHKSTAP